MSGLSEGPRARSRRSEIRKAIADRRIDLPALIAGDADPADETEALRMDVGVLLGADAVATARMVHIARRGGLASLNVKLGTLPMATRRALAEAVRDVYRKEQGSGH